jgi:hypothetical protein
VNNTDPVTIRRTSWQVDVLDRLCGVREDVRRAISAAGWTLKEDGNTGQICPQGAAPGQGTRGATTQDDASIRLMSEAQAVVDTTYQYIRKTKETIDWLSKRRQRFWDLLTGDVLMSAYINLHAAESTRVLLLSSDQLAAILPSIRKRASAFLPADDPNSDALKTIPDPTQPAHQAVAARVQAQTGPATRQAQAPGNGNSPPPGAHPDGDPNAVSDSNAASDLSQPTDPNASRDENPPGNQHGSQGQQPSSDNTANQTASPGAIVLTDILGPDQQAAAQVMNAACRAEDQQQLQVRHFRSVLYGASAALLVVVAVLWIVGSIHPAYFPLCWPVSGSHPAMICPTGGSKPTAADVPLVLGLGALGAALSVALSLADLKPAGVRFSLTVAQGLNKIVLGAIIAVLGIIVLRTVTNAPGFLGTQPGLLTTAVVFGYSQQVFTRLIDRQASQLTNAASPATPAAQLSASPERKPPTNRSIDFLLRSRAGWRNCGKPASHSTEPAHAGRDRTGNTVRPTFPISMRGN